MDKFCKFCGKPTDENSLCDCPQSLANVPQEVSEPKVIDAEVVNGVVTTVSEQPHKESEDSNVIEEEKITTEPAPAKVKSEKKENTTGKEVGGTFASFLIHPIKTTNKAEEIPLLASFILILLNALAFLLFSFVGFRNIFSKFPSLLAGTIAPLLSVFLSSIVLFLVLFIFSKISRPTLSIKGALGTTALSSTAWIVSLIILTIASFFWRSYGLTSLIMLLISAFSFVFSILIVDRGVNSKVTADGRRIFIVSLGVVLQMSTFAVVYFYIFSKFGNFLPFLNNGIF